MIVSGPDGLLLVTMSEARSYRAETSWKNVITLLKSVLASGDPSRRAESLAEAQRQLGWAQRRVIDECQHHKLSWRQIGAVAALAAVPCRRRPPRTTVIEAATCAESFCRLRRSGLCSAGRSGGKAADRRCGAIPVRAAIVRI